MIKTHRHLLQAFCAGALLTTSTLFGQTGANPNIPFYGGGGTITANPQYPIVGENTHIAVIVGNSGPQAATNVRVKISFNDWGVTYSGWQEIATITLASIPAGSTATAETDFVFQNRTHTCLEALIVGADTDDDPNDDRGQINLEVINAGETFSYGVPVVNNGNQPVDLLLIGQCRGKGVADGQGAKCKEEAQQVHLDPGEEVLVPVEVDLHGVAPGQEVVFQLDAYDVSLGADGFLPANHNYVEIHIVRQSARGLKKAALASLNAISLQVTANSLRNRINEAAKKVQHALENPLWVDADHVRKGGGAQIFADEQSALNQVLQLLGANLPATVKDALNQLALQLTDADRILAEAANDAAGGIAQTLIDQGDAQRVAGDYASAVGSYKNAWQMANK